MRRTIAALLLIAASAAAQTASQPKPAFEVASVKIAAPMDDPYKKMMEGTISISGANLSIRNGSLHLIIRTAYGLADYQVTGPAWLKQDRFDVVAKASAPASLEQMRPMLQALLADRFKLESHRETKEITLGEIVLGKGAPKIGSPKPEGPGRMRLDSESMSFENYSMPRLAEYLSRLSAGRPILDRTKIEGFYDFSVHVTESASGDLGDVKRAMEMSMRDGSLPKTIVEGIGLRLEYKKGPIETLVVDRAERSPAEN